MDISGTENAGEYSSSASLDHDPVQHDCRKRFLGVNPTVIFSV